MTRQLENGKAHVRPGGIVEAIYRPTGARGRYRAQLNNVTRELVMKPEDHTLPECGLDSLIVLKVVRRGFGK